MRTRGKVTEHLAELWKHQVDKTKCVYLITRGATPVIVLLDIEEAWKYVDENEPGHLSIHKVEVGVPTGWSGW
jgi:hypothetical protein